MSLFKPKLIFFQYVFLLASVKAFTVYWNSPSQQCLRNYGHDFTNLLSTYGILVNTRDQFQGNRITIFYEPQLGLYPKISTDGTFINGGIPQAGNLSRHLERAAKDIEIVIPNKKFDGVGVIDWEAWRPSWNFNWGPLKIYREKSIEFTKKNNPTLTDKEIEELAISQWENASERYMLETLLLAKKLRPLARWGYYLFPDCYNYMGNKPEDFECSPKIKSENDKLSWLWDSSTSIHPSVYLYESYLDKYTMEERIWKDHGKLMEGIRVAPADAKVLPYVNYFLNREFVPQDDFRRIVAQTASIGADGLILWGSSSSVSSKQRCDGLKEYIIETLGPTIERVSWNFNSCSKLVCNGNGFCTWPNDTSATAWKLFLQDKPSFLARDVVCKCKTNYVGRFCEKLISFI